MGKIINRNKCLEILKSGGYLYWDTFAGKPTIYDKEEDFIGNLQYRTYEIIRKHTAAKLVNTERFGYETRHYFKPQLTNLEELEKDIPRIKIITSEDLYKLMARIQKEIEKRNHDAVMKGEK